MISGWLSQKVNVINYIHKLYNLMSVYGGFPTRRMEARYSDLLHDLLTLMQGALSKYILRQQVDQPLFKAYFQKLYRSLGHLQSRKYVPPKYAPLLRELNTTCDNKIMGIVSIPTEVRQKQPEPVRIRMSKHTIDQSVREEKSHSIDSFNCFPVTVIYGVMQPLYNMRWPEKAEKVREVREVREAKESPSLRVIGEEQQEEDVMKDARKRIKSGVPYGNKVNQAPENVRPNTSVNRQAALHRGVNTMDNDIDDYKDQSQTLYLASQKYSSQKHRRESAGEIPNQRKQLYQQLQKYASTLDINQYMAQIPVKKKPTTRTYRIAKLF